jgi:hypothetical protein
MDQLKWVGGLFTGHCHLKEHLFKLGLTNYLISERCLEEDESATQVLCDCEAIAHLRFRPWVSSSWNEVTIMTPP